MSRVAEDMVPRACVRGQVAACAAGRAAGTLPGVPTTRGPRAVGALLATLAACDGRGAAIAGQVAEGFGEAMRTIAIILMVFAALVAAVYVAVWVRLIVTWRRGQASRVAAVTLVGVHALGLMAAGASPDEPIYPALWWTAPLPALALGIAAASRWPVRLAVAAAVTVTLCLLPARAVRLRVLPAPIVDVSVGPLHACAALLNGEVVCVGDPAATCREPYASYPGKVDALKGADAVFAVYGATCVRRREGPVECCGAGLPEAPETGGRWTLPVGGPGSALVVTSKQVLARTGEALRGWPHPLPEGLTGARAIAGEQAIETHFAAVDRAGVLWMWRQNGAAIERLARFPGLVDAAEVAVHRRTGACVRREGGAVACFPWPDERGEPFEVNGVRAVQLVALDDAFDSFCARAADGVVVCWEDDARPRPEERPFRPRPFRPLPLAARLVAVDAALCDVAGRVRCVPAGSELDGPLRELLALQ